MNDDLFRRWASRPTPTSPSEAARRVRARLESARPRARGWWLMPATAVAAVLALVGPRGLSRREPPPPTPTPLASAVSVAPIAEPLPDNVVLWWIDADTPVYFVVGPPATSQGGPS